MGGESREATGGGYVIHEIDLSSFVDHGRATVREVGREAIWRQRRADAFYRLDRRSERILGPLDCDCSSCLLEEESSCDQQRA